MSPEYFQAGSLVWPLTVILLALVILRDFREEVQPIVRSMRDALAQQATKNAMAWAMAMMVGASASMQAMVDVFHQLNWYYGEAAARIIGPGLIAVIALLRNPPNSSPPTNPPFPK
jgi:hypothetical protein